MSRQLLEILVKDRLITQEQFEEAATAPKTGKVFVRYLLEKKYLSENKLLNYLTHKFGLPSINLAKYEIPPEISKVVPHDVARKYNVVAVQANNGVLVVAICDPTVISSFEQLKFVVKMNIEAVLTSYSIFDGAMSKYYGSASSVVTAAAAFQKEFIKEQKESKSDVADIVQVHNVESEGGDATNAPIIRAVNGILTEAIRIGASDIHIEPFEHRLRVRMRIDGALVAVSDLPSEMKRPLVVRLKIMSKMDIAETRVPQDGRIKIRSSGKDMDFRVNSMPTLFGEKFVLRLLSQGNLQLDMIKLGFEPKQLESFKKGIYAPNGLVLVTGPTGSGKTTTLYSALSELNQVTENLSTAEDPVEYNLEGINQVQIHKEVGLTFAAVLRALLRQDPDVILVGEIRDYETAEIAIQAALTGHLVLSTLHTNDAPSTITRLMNMGVEPFLVVASLNAILAQRLLRRVCTLCKTQEQIPVSKLIELGVPENQAKTMKCIKGKGCMACNKTGYKGRVAIYEVLDFSTKLKEMVLAGENNIEIKKAAIKEGMKPLRESALSKVIEGVTSLEEALSSTMEV